MAKISDSVRAHVVTLLRETPPRGYRDIAEQTGVSLATISKIAGEEGIESTRAAQTQAAAAAAGQAHKRKWAELRAELVDELGEVATVLLDKARNAPARDAQSLMTAVAIGIDKAQLLSGGVTSRHEQLDAQRRRERVEALEDELEQRRKAKDAATGG